MSEYLTPLKESNAPTPKSSQGSSRQGDWVCLSCHNLNFSFRKKCNRCKVQTRDYNQQQTDYYYHCQQYYLQHQKENFPSLKDNTPMEQPTSAPSLQPSQCSLSAEPSSPLQSEAPLTPTKGAGRGELPSVSPLVKRWKRHGNDSTEQSKRGGLFENESTWANIDLTYFEEEQLREEAPHQPSREEREEEELEWILQRIIL